MPGAEEKKIETPKTENPAPQENPQSNNNPTPAPPPEQPNQEEIPEELRPLTVHQEKFCQEYARSSPRSGGKCAVKAGYSYKTAEEEASRLLSYVRIQDRIQEIIEQDMREAKLSVAGVLRSIMEIAEADPINAYNEDGSLKPIKQIPTGLRKAIASIEVDELWDKEINEDSGRYHKVQIGVTKTIKFWNKNEALRDLGKHLKLFVEIIEHQGLQNLAAKVKAARERVKKNNEPANTNT